MSTYHIFYRLFSCSCCSCANACSAAATSAAAAAVLLLLSHTGHLSFMFLNLMSMCFAMPTGISFFDASFFFFLGGGGDLDVILAIRSFQTRVKMMPE